MDSEIWRWTTTTFEIPGYRVGKSLGIVRGVTVRSNSILGTSGGSLQTFVGGNAVIGVRYDATEVLCSGTAVQLEPVAP